MEKILVGLGLKYVATKLDGKKTIFGAIIMMLMGIGKMGTGVIMLVGIMWPDIYPPELSGPVNIDLALETIQAGAVPFGMGLAALGIGHKVEKTKDQPAQ